MRTIRILNINAPIRCKGCKGRVVGEEVRVSSRLTTTEFSCLSCGECFNVIPATLPSYSDEVDGVCFINDAPVGAVLRFDNETVHLRIEEVKALRDALTNVIDTAMGL